MRRSVGPISVGGVRGGGRKIFARADAAFAGPDVARALLGGCGKERAVGLRGFIARCGACCDLYGKLRGEFCGMDAEKVLCYGYKLLIR